MSGWLVPKGYEAQQELFEPYVKAFDKILAVYFVAAGAHLESPKRREYYGLAGEYRLPPHGLEYRTLSSVPLSHPAILNLAFEMTRGIIALVDCNAQDLWVSDRDETIGVINENNQKAARALITRNKELLTILTQIGRFESNNRKWGNKVYNIAMNGIDSVIMDPGDFVNNWKFNGGWTGHGHGQNEGFGNLRG